MPISKNKIKYIRSLEQKKTRREEGVFVAEGPKLTGDLLGRFHCRYLAATAEWMNAHPLVQADEKDIANLEDLQRASLLKTPQDVIAVFEQRNEATDTSVIERELCLALDDVQDPGNLGTIIRIADWFGIEHIFCSLGTADVYNPKVVQATMGAIFRVKFYYCSVPALCKDVLARGGKVYGTFLDGQNMYQKRLECGYSVIVIGNEANGISKETAACVSDRLFIPPYPADDPGSESLNAAVATAVTVAEFRRPR